VFRAPRFFRVADFALALQSFCSYYRPLFFPRIVHPREAAFSFPEIRAPWKNA
jgi:hypothetical protein